MIAKKVSAVALQSLKEALTAVYWYKSDLRSFLTNCLSNKSIIAQADWKDGYKRQIVSDIVDTLASDQDNNLGDLRRLFHEVTNVRNFRHLEELEDGKRKADKARKAVEDLRALVETHDGAHKRARASRKAPSGTGRKAPQQFRSAAEAFGNLQPLHGLGHVEGPQQPTTWV